MEGLRRRKEWITRSNEREKKESGIFLFLFLFHRLSYEIDMVSVRHDQLLEIWLTGHGEKCEISKLDISLDVYFG